MIHVLTFGLNVILYTTVNTDIHYTLHKQRPWSFDFELGFYIPLDTKQVISETFFLANILA